MRTEPELRQDLEQILAYLERPELTLVDRSEADDLANRARDLLERIKAADDRIVIGLVGGTGVGKSTLINALAGRKISTGSDLRPTTNHLVLYKHQDNDFSLSGDEEVHLHQAADLARISLADFPDFDSIEPEHRRALARHFPRLDLLIWVADPVKYADQAFFHWLDLAPQARINSLFVLNKIDEFQRRYGEAALEVSDEVRRDFADKLEKHAGRNHPEILTLSALAAEQGRPDQAGSGFQALRERLEELGRKKLRLAIKNLNLESMADHLRRELQALAAPDQARPSLAAMGRLLEGAASDLKTQVRLESQRLITVFGRSWRTALAAQARDLAPWPLDFFLFIWNRLGKIFTGGRAGQHPGPELIPPDLTALTRRIETMRLEMTRTLGPEGATLGRSWINELRKSPPLEEAAAAAARSLVLDGRQKQEELTRQHRWRIRQHLLPLLVLAYPFLPLALAWVLALISSTDAAPGANVEFYSGWKDALYLVETVLGLYLLETVYFAYSLDRRAGLALEELAKVWETTLTGLVQIQINTPARAFESAVLEEIDLIQAWPHP
jgi:GTPase SAR1 family protein